MTTSKQELQVLNFKYEYRRWRSWFSYYISGLGLEDHLTEKEVPTEAGAKQKFLKDRNKVMALLYRTISLKYTGLIEGLETPVAVLKALDNNFNKRKFEEI